MAEGKRTLNGKLRRFQMRLVALLDIFVTVQKQAVETLGAIDVARCTGKSDVQTPCCTVSNTDCYRDTHSCR
jgi:hypothetical protein